MGGRIKDEWSKSGFKDCLQQSKKGIEPRTKVVNKFMII